MLKYFVTLKDGTQFRLRDVESVEYTAESLTGKTIHKLVLHNKSIVFVQGDNISYFKLER